MRLAGVVGLLLVAALLVAVAGMVLEAPPSASTAESSRGRVERVVDGDTLILRIDGLIERVRYVGIDAPELGPAECYALEALRVHEQIVDGAELRLERDVSDRDRFDRLLRHAWVEVDGSWEHVGEALVAAGAARARSYPPDTGMDDRLRDAERQARRAGAGMWAACDVGGSVILGGG
jgi:micrococcal nuclease